MTFSIWQVIIFLAAMALFVLVVFIDRNSNKRLPRISFLRIVIGSVLGALVNNFLYEFGSIDAGPRSKMTLLLVSLIIGLAIWLFLELAVSRRLRDIGRSPWIALLINVPLANLILIVYCLIAKGRQGCDLTEDAAKDVRIARVGEDSTEKVTLGEKAFSFAMFSVYVGYFFLGAFQLAATMQGLEVWGLHWFVAMLIALFVAYIPLVGTIAGVVGAVYGWGWHWPSALGLFFGPMVVVVGIALSIAAFEGVLEQRNRQSREAELSNGEPE